MSLGERAAAGHSLSRLGFCGFSFCLQPDVCFVGKGLVPLTANGALARRAAGSAVTGSSVSCGRKGPLIVGAAEPFCHDAEPLSEPAFH